MAAVSSTTPRHLPDGWIVPAVTDANRRFFTTGELWLQRCADCGAVQHPPTELCGACQSFELEQLRAHPAGVVEAVTVVHHPLHPLLEPAVPYNVVIVALDEHPSVRVVGNVVDAPPDGVRIGTRVEGCWAAVAGDDGGTSLLLPQWRSIS